MIEFVHKYIKISCLCLLVLMFASSCRDVVIKLEKVPENTPVGATIYLAGNFNFWDPGDTDYKLKLNKDSSYTIELPRVFGDLEYKFTRGDWSTVEKNKCGFEIENRIAFNTINDTLVNSVESWADLEPINCDSITIVLKEIPSNTPKNDEIKIAGNFNAWNPDSDSIYTLKTDSNTKELSVTIPIDSGKTINEILYKIVRGEQLSSEANKFGEPIEKRKLMVSKEGRVYIKVEKWEDLAKKRLNTVTIVLNEIPENTPESSSIYLVGNFNDWQPGDSKYEFRINENGLYSITIPRQEYGLSFKITRGGWHTEAADEHGNNLNNMDYNYDEIDTVNLSIDNWLDLTGKKVYNSVTIVLSKIPENTPESSSIYLVGNFNDWQPGNVEYTFKRTDSGKHFITLPRLGDKLSFKITRGDWNMEAADKRGRKLNNRDFHYDQDTLFIDIENWFDLPKD